jgi:hypothetical protein
MSAFVRNFLLIIFSSVVFFASAQDQTMPEENGHCLSCHANQIYSFHNEWLEVETQRLMNPFYIIDSTKMVAGVHGSFRCTDCHSPDYETYPHNAELKLEPLNTCIDCHGGDDTYASYQFDKIEEEFHKSVHFEKSGESFSCSKCHDQHYYRATARNSSNVSEIVSYANDMCLSCHDDVLKFQMVSSEENPQLNQVHAWLPNQELHFKNVRCIECHTVVVDSFLVSHNIMPKENALRNCNSCHSSNSLLKASLYKYENLKARSESDKIGALIQNEAYIIGANQNPMMRVVSFIIFGLTLFAAGVHWVFRMIKRK